MAVLLLCGSFLGACAKEEPKVRWEQDKGEISGEIETIKAAGENRDEQIGKNSARLDGLDAVRISKRLKDLEKVNRAQQAQIDALTARISRLHRKRKSVAAATGQQSASHTTTAVKPPVAPPVTTVADSAIDRTSQAEAEKNAYTSAYLALKSGRFEEASRGFNEQLDQFPDGEYADQAWYWLGEARLAQRAREHALHAFKYVVDHYPDSVKHAAALLKLGQLSEYSGAKKRAKGYYERLLREHPESTHAEQARTALAEMKAVEAATTEKQQ